MGGPANPLEGGETWSAGRGALLDLGGEAQGAVGGVAPYPGGVPALGGGGGGGTGATERVGVDAGAGGTGGIDGRVGAGPEAGVPATGVGGV